jgi:hypothetical protein
MQAGCHLAFSSARDLGGTRALVKLEKDHNEIQMATVTREVSVLCESKATRQLAHAALCRERLVEPSASHGVTAPRHGLQGLTFVESGTVTVRFRFSVILSA